MTVIYKTDRTAVYHGDALDILRGLSEESVQCCVTSPPYWGLRDYGMAGQLGMESTPEEYVEKMVEIFAEVRRVLRCDGTLWLNLGDSYAASSNTGGTKSIQGTPKRIGAMTKRGHSVPDGLKPKDIIGIPWRVAFALQADGWYLRSDIIWHKSNPMPESVTDRPTKAHEYIFLMSKSPKYFYDAAAIKEPVTGTTNSRGHGVNPKAKAWKTPDGWDTSKGQGGHGAIHKKGRERGRPKQNESFSAAVSGLVDSRNKRTVWTIPTAPFSGAHFATYPPRLVDPCIKAGCPAGGTVMDPFMGAATTGMVALKLDCKFIGIEINEEYINALAIPRIEAEEAQPGLFA